MKRRRGQGAFVVLEGLDGAGTTTQAEAIARKLRSEGVAVLATREPSDGPIGNLLRQALTRRVGLPNGRGPLGPETLALLFAADRVDHLAAQIEPALEKGEVVICDRYLLSSLAYQGSELPMLFVEQINQKARRPDLTLFVEVSTRIAAQRRATRGGEKELFDAEARQKKIAGLYREAIAQREGTERIVSLDGGLPIAQVTQQALAAIARVL